MAKVTLTFEDDEESGELVMSGEFEPEFRGDLGEQPTNAQNLALQVTAQLEAWTRSAGGRGIVNEGDPEHEDSFDAADDNVARWQ